MSRDVLDMLLLALIGLVDAVFISSGLLFFYFWDTKKLRNIFGIVFGVLLAAAIIISAILSEGSITYVIANTFSLLGGAALPTAPLIWFFISLAQFLAAPKDSDERRSRKISIILSAVMSVIVCGGTLFFLWGLLQGLANM
ncbi:MAG: hypothetical protein IJ386_02705 [Clostridia bacterium]|nr:hypothetical protein [Clostridia bacterium]